MIEIPLRKDLPHFDVTVDLDEQTFTIEVYWNSRHRNYYLNIYDQDDVLLVGGIKISVYYPLRGILRDDRLFTGFLFAADATVDDPVWTDGVDRFVGDAVERVPGFGELGDRVRVYYQSASEVTGG